MKPDNLYFLVTRQKRQLDILGLSLLTVICAMTMGPVWAQNGLPSNEVYTIGLFGVYRIDVETGTPVLVSDFQDGNSPASRVGLSGAIDMTLTPDGSIFALLPTQLFTGAPATLWHVDPITGTRTMISDFTDPSQGLGSDFPYALTATAAGDLLVLEYINEDASNTRSVLVKVDPNTGARTVLIDFNVFSNPNNPFETITNIPSTFISLSPQSVLMCCGHGGPQANFDGSVLFEMDIPTDQRRLIVDLGSLGLGFSTFRGELTLTPQGKIIFLASTPEDNNRRVLYEIDRGSGESRILSDLARDVTGLITLTPRVTTTPAGTLVLLDVGLDDETSFGLYEVDPETGQRRLIIDLTEGGPAGMLVPTLVGAKPMSLSPSN